MINAIAIDDEPVALDIIRRHAAMVPTINLRGVYANAKDALAHIQAERPDLVLFDINMPGMSGLEFAKQAPIGVQLVFTTAHSDYAVDGFELAITDFLLKPISFQRFLRACTLVENKLVLASQSKGVPVLFIRNGHDLVRICIDDLLYIKAENNYIGFVEHNRFTLSRMTMSEVLSKLPAAMFYRVHKSYVVNLNYIEKMQINRLVIGKLAIPISRSKMSEIKARLLERGR